MQIRSTKPTSDPANALLNEQNPRSRILGSLLRILLGLMERRFFGSVELKFEAGNLVVLRKTETLKTEDLCRDNRGNHEQNQSQ